MNKLFFLGVSNFSDHYTAENIEKAVLVILESWEIPKTKICGVVTDGAPNITLAGKKLRENVYEQIHCFGHEIQLMLEHVFEKSLKDNTKPEFTSPIQ